MRAAQTSSCVPRSGVVRRAVALTLFLLAGGTAHALVLESPACEVLTHVSGEFTNRTVLDERAISHIDVVPVTPFHACESLSHMDLTGKIALVVRGECNFVQKVWNAQRANATAVVKDQHASSIRIPSVFVSYATGSRILQSLQRSGPWNPVQLTLSSDGELPSSKASNSLLKRVVAYVFLVSAVCVFSSGLSLISSAIFRFVGKQRRTRASRKLPVVAYRSNLQQLLLQELLHEQNVIDHIALADLGCDYDGDDTHDGHVLHALDRTHASSGDFSDEEACAICLDDFVSGVDVKVLPCQHFYHIHCIGPWLERQSSRCPLCKQDAVTTDASLPPKRIFGFSLPRMEQILQHEHVFHTFFLMLPASIVSCLIVNSAASVISSLWP
ncbi:hypothetical protein PybrP1_005783 [[Pythium] brassicae (nom. inval.)]|nr:hypothetical protein PybrP1_005783 [[Pythium] brassicae (nom. inval.)]